MTDVFLYSGSWLLMGGMFGCFADIYQIEKGRQHSESRLFVSLTGGLFWPLTLLAFVLLGFSSVPRGLLTGSRAIGRSGRAFFQEIRPVKIPKARVVTGNGDKV